MSSMTAEQYYVLLPIAASVAVGLKRQFPMVDREDIEQEAWLWALQRPRKVTEYLSPEATEEDPEPEPELGKVARAMKNQARKFCLKEKAQHEGYSVDDLSWYTTKELGTLVSVVLDDKDAWATPPQQDGEKMRGGDPAIGGNWLAMLADVSRAYDSLPGEDREVLALRYGAGEEDKKVLRELAEEYEVTVSTVHKRITKALERLQDLLGGRRPERDEPEVQYIGSRPRMTNAQAMAIIEGDYEA